MLPAGVVLLPWLLAVVLTAPFVRTRSEAARVLPTLLLGLTALWALVSAVGNDLASPSGGGAPTTLSLSPRGEIGTTVTGIVDGDTLDVAFRGERVRLIGIDSPEVGGDAQCFGREASAHAAELVPAGTAVVLRFDVEERDRYGRLLVYLWRADGLFVNEAMVRDGYASVSTVPPNVTHEARFLAAERTAREEGRGRWSACTESPRVHTRR